MAFGRSKKTEPTPEPSKPIGKLPETTQARIRPDDPRGRGHETTYQASRGGWFKKN